MSTAAATGQRRVQLGWPSLASWARVVLQALLIMLKQASGDGCRKPAEATAMSVAS